MTAQTDSSNKQTLVHNGSQEAFQYFGCWLDFNQTDAQFPANVPFGNDGPFSGRLPIMQLVRGIHQCLVAEVRFQPGATDPIPNGATPASSDRLAQRNLAIVESDNPGIAATHVVQHTLLMKPSKVIPQPRATGVLESDRRSRYDELVIRWNDVPRDTVATVYSPDWSADEILKLAASLRVGPPTLTRVDANTIACTVDAITYIPVPGQINKPLPGLITLQLPLSVRAGQLFRVDVQQHSGLTFRRTTSTRDIEASRAARQDVNLSARKVLGAFRMNVAVKVGQPLLHKAVRNLAALRYIQEAIPADDSWRLVFTRYISQLADKVRGLGVDPDQIKPSPDDPGIPVGPAGKLDCHTGKVSEVIFDCFGDFEGFVLETCETCHRFASSERAIGDLVLRACKERLLISVCVKSGHKDRICKIIVLSGNADWNAH